MSGLGDIDCEGGEPYLAEHLIFWECEIYECLGVIFLAECGRLELFVVELQSYKVEGRGVTQKLVRDSDTVSLWVVG